jgi:hypothetical protein
LTNNNNTAGTYSDIKWQYTASDSSYASGIRFKQLNSSHGGQLEFFTDNTTGAYTQRMTITENGNVGIGIASPTAKLHVNGDLLTNDLILTNMDREEGPNEVDGTRGHWCIQEGAEDLFLINRNTGKKYKFNITEVVE